MKSTYLLILMALLLAACKKDNSQPTETSKAAGPFKWEQRYSQVSERDLITSTQSLYTPTFTAQDTIDYGDHFGGFYVIFKRDAATNRQYVVLQNSYTMNSGNPNQTPGITINKDTLIMESYRDRLCIHGQVKFVAYAADSSYYLRGDKDSILLRFRP